MADNFDELEEEGDFEEDFNEEVFDPEEDHGLVDGAFSEFDEDDLDDNFDDDDDDFDEEDPDDDMD